MKASATNTSVTDFYVAILISNGNVVDKCLTLFLFLDHDIYEAETRAEVEGNETCRLTEVVVAGSRPVGL